MNVKRISRGCAWIAGAIIAASVQSTHPPCEGFVKQVSVDGGVTWFDADDASMAPQQVLGGAVEYRFIVTNCEETKNCYDLS